MPSQFPPQRMRLPKATIDGAYGAIMTRVARRMWGNVPDNAYVLWHNKPVLKAVFGFEQKVGRWSALDPHLKTYAEMASAGVIGCAWCLDFGYFLAHTNGLDEAKVREVPRWRESAVFTDLDRQLGHAAMVELTMMVAVENQRSRFNSAMGLTSQGFSDVCELPLAEAGTISR